MPASDQWVITVVAEGKSCPFDLVNEFLENLHLRGKYKIISSVITPATGIASGTANNNDNNDSAPAREYPTSAEILDGHDYATTYAGISVSSGVR